MILYPNAKINLGLFVTEKRSDGFHNIETIFYPLEGLSDILEVVLSQDNKSEFTFSGLSINCEPKDNIIQKAYNLIDADFGLPPLKVHLHKIIPFGAGLGGGSSDAAFMLKAINVLCGLKLSTSELEEYASKIGSDCAFFIRNKPVFAYGRGELFEEVNLSLSNYYIALIKPEIFVSTADAYALIKPKSSAINLRKLSDNIQDWKDVLVNDFEEGIFSKYPEINEIKSYLYDLGAIYSSMSGSGSSVYGIFKDKPNINNYKNCFVFKTQII